MEFGGWSGGGEAAAMSVKMESDRVVPEEKRYIQLGPESVQTAAESVGIANLAPAVARALAEDASYRVREVADLCAQLLRHSKKRRLTTDIVNKAFKWKNIDPVVGHRTSLLSGLDRFEQVPDSDMFAEREAEVNLVAESLRQNSSPLRELNLSVSASWLCLQGIPLPLNPEENNKVIPLNSSLSPALVQYYTTLTSYVLGDSEQLCRIVMQDVRQNQRLSSLLPYLVTFIRVCMNRYREKPGVATRLIRLISALFSNPHLNLAPKPYLSYLVSTLLSSIILERRERSTVPPLEHVELAASVLAQALERWATPVNQLRLQTLKALKEYCGISREGSVTFSQYGALSALCVLGPQVLEEVLLPQLETNISGIAAALGQCQDQERRLNLQTLASLRLAGVLLIRYWSKSNRSDNWIKIVRLYRILYSSFGDSILGCIINSGSLKRPKTKEFGRVYLRKILIKINPGVNRQDSVELFAGQSKKAQPGILSEAQNFDYLADMGVPSDIFEPSELESTADKHESENYSSYFKPRVQSVSVSVAKMFPDGRSITVRPRALRLRLGPCRQLEPDKYAQKRPGQLLPVGMRIAPWRNFAVGGRYGARHRKRDSPTFQLVPDYTDILMYA